jgi:8-oxo-dGTP pyrophosphatase MutT (NUDIX family)/phosphohistidine phosphatase SixA
VANKPSVIRAGGGVIVRDGSIALVHRPRYDDWTLPKGKLGPGESPAAGAVREIAEETGARVALTQLLGRVTYPVETATKIVDYWQMRYLDGEFEPSEEVDRVEWLSADDARVRLSYRHDRRVIDASLRLPVVESVLILVRHARAGSRSQWAGPDALRPLEESGRTQARLLAPFLAAFGPDQIVSADRTRCVQTVEPLAELAGLAIERDSRLGDEGYAKDPKRALEVLHGLLSHSPALVLCSQGDAIPAMLHDLRVVPRSRPAKTRKGGVWVIGFAGRRAVRSDYYRTPLSPR